MSWLETILAGPPSRSRFRAAQWSRPLVERGFHVYAINPKQLDRFRDRHSVPGAKDDGAMLW